MFSSKPFSNHLKALGIIIQFCNYNFDAVILETFLNMARLSVNVQITVNATPCFCGNFSCMRVRQVVWDIMADSLDFETVSRDCRIASCNDFIRLNSCRWSDTYSRGDNHPPAKEQFLVTQRLYFCDLICASWSERSRTGHSGTERLKPEFVVLQYNWSYITSAWVRSLGWHGVGVAVLLEYSERRRW
jgi:hypothetical protein